MAKQKVSSQRLAGGMAIRTQVILVVGVLLALGLFIATIGFISLRSLQLSGETTMSKYVRAEELSAAIQSEFLLARQSEAAFINAWRLTGFDEDLESYVAENKNHITQARAHLSQLEALVAQSDNAELNTMTSEIQNLRPLLDDYSQAFDATVLLVRQRTEPGGLDSTLKGTFLRLNDGLIPLPDNVYVLTAYKMQAAQEKFYSTRRQEYVDNFRIQNDRLLTLLNESKPEELDASALTIPQLKYLVDDQYKFFLQVVSLEQKIDTNSAIFQETTVGINENIARVAEKSISSAVVAQADMMANGQQSAVTMVIATVLAVVLGLAAGIAHTLNLVGPIRNLAQAASEMGAGKLERQVSVWGPKEIRQLGNEFNSMAGQLFSTLTGLEERVEERTKALARRSTQLQASAEVARNATSIRDLDVLLNTTVNLIRERFGFYHAGIFLVDPRREYAVLRASTGEAGREMLERKHKLKVGEVGLVGAVCSTGEPRISQDVGEDSVHFRNPLLPDTRSEMALPLKSGRQTIGAIDVQSTQPAAFDEQDISVLQSMADQLAIAIDNARLFQDSQENIQQLQTVYGSYSKQAWDNLSAGRLLYGYTYETGEIQPITTPEETDAPISIPLTVRGAVIGALDVWPGEEGLSGPEMTMLKSVSERISQAMESARLYEDAQDRATREKSLSQLTAMFTQSLSFDTILKTAVQELGKMPNVTEASIQLEIPEQER